MSRRSALLPAGAVAVLLALLSLVIRVPYVELVPGPVTNTLGKRSDGVPLITVTGRRTYPTSGHLDLTTVGVSGGPDSELSAAQALAGWFQPHAAVVPQDAVFPPGESQKVVEQQNTRQMVDSQQDAISAALTSLKVPFRTEVLVGAVEKGTPADGQLRVGDELRAVDGTAVTSAQALRTLISRRTPGQLVRVTVDRNGVVRQLSIRTAADRQDPKRAIIGVATAERAKPPFTVTINLKDVGGPSAGLMFALGIIDTLTPGQLNGGKHIAGTGTITTDGTVGPIGGIAQKVVAARDAGASVFLTPVANCRAAASNRPAGLTLVRVATLSEALDRLAAIRAGRPVPTC
jgi:PDZ domain-containing protein